MGSALEFEGVGPLKNVIREYVWDEDLGNLLRTLSVRPERLNGPLRPVYVLSEIRCFNFLPKIDFYGGLVSHLRSLGYRENVNFSLFPYDWRQDNLHSARLLLAKMNVLRERARRVVLLAHSMGCLVCRLALKLGGVQIREMVDSLVQIAPPTSGSASAYVTLKRFPELHRIVDAWIRLRVAVRPDLSVRLHNAVQHFPSLYQLLPPTGQAFLLTLNGDMFSAFHQDAWPKEVRSHVLNAEEVQKHLTQIGVDSLTTIYSGVHDTVQQVLVDEHFNVLKKIKTRTRGDGRVTISSATHDSIETRRRLITDKRGLHDRLPTLEPVLEELTRILR